MASPSGPNLESREAAPVPENLARIEHIVVLMLENRSFDHLFGYLRDVDPKVAGLIGNEFNREDPRIPDSARIPITNVEQATISGG
jgi:phospholipase C